MLIQKALELVFIPSSISLFSFYNESRVGSDPMTQGFIDSERRLNINQFNEEKMLIESG
jgi:uncharacterized membrane protein